MRETAAIRRVERRRIMKNILIIDDDEFILLGLSKALSEYAKDSEVLTAQHGKQAVEILDSCPVDFIVTDLKMPIMNGYEVVAYANKNHPRIPVYVMTGDYLPEVKQKFRAAAVSRFVSKPFSFRQLAADISSKLAATECPHPAAV
jgi:CheY-like chemotaxis protein